MAKIALAGSDNAIVQVSFGFEWQEPLTPSLFMVLSALHSTVETTLPRKQEIREALSVKVFAGENPNVEQDGVRTVAVVMDALNRDGSVLEQLSIGPNSIVYSDFGPYTRWSDVHEKAVGVMAPFLDILARERKFGVCGIQYVDAFELDEIANLASTMFSPEAVLLPKHIFQIDDLWHVNQGYFKPADIPQPHKRLTNLNMQVNKHATGYRLEISAMHRAVFENPIESYEAGLLQKLQDDLHEDNKNILRDILTQDIRDMVGLDRQG